MPDPDLVERIAERPRRSLAAATYRHVSRGRQPLSGEGARIQGGRWNPRESFPTLYVGLTEAVVVAEFHRLAIRSGRSTADFLPRSVYRIDVSLGLVLDLTDASTVSAVGVTAAQLAADDPGACQAIGDAAHYLGFEAVLAPSATGRGSALAIYTDRLQPSSILTPHHLGEWDDGSPAEA